MREDFIAVGYGELGVCVLLVGGLIVMFIRELWIQARWRCVTSSRQVSIGVSIRRLYLGVLTIPIYLGTETQIHEPACFSSVHTTMITSIRLL